MFAVLYSTYFKQKYKDINDPQQQQLIRNFATDVGNYGLFPNPLFQFPGKLGPSWSNLDSDDSKAIYAKKYKLWHYHIGHTQYTQGNGPYLVSDWIVHFIWDKYSPANCNNIKLVDYTPHKILGSFPQPLPHTLV